MKIAIASDDGKLVSQFLDHAQFYIVITVEDGRMVQCELRHKLERNLHIQSNFSPEPFHYRLNHTSAINDCDVLVCGGMRRDNYENLEALRIDPILTDIRTVGLALRTYLGGNLINQAWRLHLFSLPN